MRFVLGSDNNWRLRAVLAVASRLENNRMCPSFLGYEDFGLRLAQGVIVLQQGLGFITEGLLFMILFEMDFKYETGLSFCFQKIE